MQEPLSQVVLVRPCITVQGCTQKTEVTKQNVFQVRVGQGILGSPLGFPLGLAGTRAAPNIAECEALAIIGMVAEDMDCFKSESVGLV